MAVHTVGHIRLDLDPVGMNLPREPLLQLAGGVLNDKALAIQLLTTELVDFAVVLDPLLRSNRHGEVVRVVCLSDRAKASALLGVLDFRHPILILELRHFPLLSASGR